MLFKDYNKSILILFAILILCSGKLLKDYLYKNNLIEGMTKNEVVTTPATLRRPLPSGTAITNASISFKITTGANITGNITLTLTCLDSELTAAGITLPTSSNSFVATGPTAANTASGDKPVTSFTSVVSTTNGIKTIRFTPIYSVLSADSTKTSQISSGTLITITITGITISTTTDVAVTSSKPVLFTISGGTSDSIQIPVIIEPPQSDRGVSGSSSSTNDIELAISNLNTAIGTNPSNSSDLIAAKNALINLLAQTYGTVTNAGTVFTSSGLYEAQKTALDFIGKEKARTNQNANIIETDNSNKKRMSQINQYYTQNYQANIAILKYVIYMSVALIVLTVLKTKEYIPPSISTLGTICILAFGSIEIGKKIYDILRRNDFDFDKYDWNFDQSKMDSVQLTQTDTNNLSTLGSFGAPCYGPGCCDAGTSWSDVTKKCTPGATLTGTAVWAPATSTLTVTITNKVDIAASTGYIKFTLPSGLFASTSSPNSSSGSFASGVFTSSNTAAILANTTTTIRITGLSLASPLPNADLIPRVITDVYSSSEPNRTQINIQGIPGYNS
jgi:hypothetical protein